MRLRILIVLVAAVGMFGCVPKETGPEGNVCGEKGEEIETSEAGEVCVYRKDEIVVETGFACPKERAVRYDRTFGDIEYVVCADEKNIGEGTFDEIEQKAFGDSGGGDDEWTASQKLDLLWVIDNSGSMCEEQAALRNNFENMMDILEQNPLDFHVAVTTTQGSESFFENVAQFGHLQSTPHPPVGFNSACRFDGEDQDGARDFTPLKEQIRAAVECTKNPSEFQNLIDPSVERLRCAIDNSCGRVSVEELFPCASANGSACESRQQFEKVYRDVPKVLRAADYRNEDGSLQLQKLKRDFACMSFVGTRGSSLEQGIEAAVEAVSPEMTGGPVEDPVDESAPNHGFLRSDANFALTFVTDENDCSHEGSVINDRQNQCAELNCYFPTKSDPQGPLLATDQLYQDFIANLADSKGIDSVNPSDVMAGSLHGNYQRYTGSIPETCSEQQRESLASELTVCSTARGSARSGDRYADFIGQFANHVPKDEKTGFMCESGSLQGPLESIATFVQNP